jgi:sugar transferase EpsL
LKRLLDLIGASILLLVLAVPMAIVALAIRVTLGSPVLFRQRRPGLHEAPFEILKFRTMSDSLDRAGRPLPDRQRLGRLGKVIRGLSLDELPELINVIRGDMSLVGPRPLLMEYLTRYTPAQARRHEVKPGITGWAQVNGRNAVGWNERFALDVWYVDHQSLWLDLKILALTVRTVLRRDGISEAGHATMSEFLGTHRRDDSEHHSVL